MRNRITRRQQRGLSLVELMVSVVIGMVVVAAVLVSYLSSGKTSQQQMAYAEMNDNAQMALSLLSRDLFLAGYREPIGLAGATFAAPIGEPVKGCDNGFVNPRTTGADDCVTAAGIPAIEVTYQADVYNTVPTSSGKASDCLGNGLGSQKVEVSNRYYLNAISTGGRNELYCASSQGSPGQPLVENIDAMKFWYGMAGAAPSRQVVRYVTAAKVGVGGVSDWSQVVSVRVCVLARSSEAALDMALYPDPLNPPKYRDCDGNEQEISDRVLRRAYFTTATLRNRMPF